ncbi:MAG: response regulator [Flavobacteriaceae bacterium]|nr:response regulator [Flavobacteriaceae bacterium]MDZ4148327.1 response regulator [Flavobacteriaceae bacterium]
MNKILIIEDDEIVLSMLRYKLTKEDFIVETVKNARLALQTAIEFKPDLILTDIMMPFVSGLEFLNIYRNELKKNTPIIVLTSLGQEETILQAFELGADDFIAKPFNANEVVIRIKKALKIVHFDK